MGLAVVAPAAIVVDQLAVRRTLRRHLREWVLIASLLCVAIAGAVHWHWLERADFWLYDTSVSLSGRAPDPDILILAIDEESVARMGRWPWSREKMADAIDRLTLAEAGPVLLDVIFAEPQREAPMADARLAAALARNGHVVLPIFMPGKGDVAVLPLPELAASSKLGHAQALVDRDGVTRRYMSIETASGVRYPHVTDHLLAQNLPSVPIQADAAAKAQLVPFAGPTGHFARRSLSALLEGRIPAPELKGRTILIGATATGLGDSLVTPLGGSGAMPGVEFVANVLDGRRAGLSTQAMSEPARLALSVALLLALMVGLLVATPLTALWATALACVGAAIFAVLWLKLYGLWWPPAAPMAAMALAYPLWSWRRLEASLSAMARETGRIAAMTQTGSPPRPGADRYPATPTAAVLGATNFFDPVETRIAAISQAVDQIATSLAEDPQSPEVHQHREDMMRHLAHDLRSPLVSLRSLAANLSNDRRTENVAMLERIDECARRALDLSEQFLLLGRAEALNPDYFGEVDLVQTLHQSADDLFEDARASGSRVERRCTLDVAIVQGDSRLLHRALLNLGWNALRHGPRGFTVTLSLEETVGGYTITVHDEGKGFAPEDMARLSQRYVQAKSTSAGHGLGLALVRLVVEKHGGTLLAETPAEGGFDMVLRLPGLAAAPNAGN